MPTRMPRAWITPIWLSVKRCRHSGSSWTASYENYHMAQQLLLGCLSQRNEHLCSQKTLYMHTYSSSVHESHTLTAPQMFSNKWMLKHSYMDYYSAIKRNELLAHTTMDDSPGNYAEWNRQLPKNTYIVCDPIYITFLKWQNFTNEQSCSCQRLEMGHIQTYTCDYKYQRTRSTRKSK